MVLRWSNKTEVLGELAGKNHKLVAKRTYMKHTDGQVYLQCCKEILIEWIDNGIFLWGGPHTLTERRMLNRFVFTPAFDGPPSCRVRLHNDRIYQEDGIWYFEWDGVTRVFEDGLFVHTSAESNIV